MDLGFDALLDIPRQPGEVSLRTEEELDAVGRGQLLEAQPLSHLLEGDGLQALALQYDSYASIVQDLEAPACADG